MKNGSKNKSRSAEIVPLFGRDEMNLIEFPFGPITAGTTKTFEVEHETFDKTLNRVVTRKLLITGSDAFGLPRPIDDQVLMGMKALTYEAGFQSKTIHFSRYHLCRTMGWPVNGRTYKRLEDAMDRIAGTTLKFKDSWWDKGESQFTSKTFHVIEEVSLCSRDQLDRTRLSEKKANHALCSFVWSDVIWKSFQDGFIKKLDMAMWRKIGSGGRRDVPLRLYRILDKRFYFKQYVTMDVRRLCTGTLGVSPNYAPSQMVRLLKRASDRLVECGFLRDVKFKPGRNGEPEATFVRATGREGTAVRSKKRTKAAAPSGMIRFYRSLSADKQKRVLKRALEHCRVHKPAAFSGFQRNEHEAGQTFEGYLDLVLSEFMKSKKRQQKSVA
ncbi:MAG: plasmid replication initiator TrfA [Planctomycetaceae bacterium]